MQQLVQIETIPIKLEVKTTRAKLERPDPLDVTSYSAAKSSSEVQVNRAVQMNGGTKSSPKTDVYVSNDTGSSFGQMLTYEAFGADSVYAEPSSPAYMQAAIKNASAMSSAVSSDQKGSALQTEMANSAMQAYSTDRGMFDLSVKFGLKDLEYVPGELEFTVAQRPEVKIEYIGSPIYVPKSADPNYVDVSA